ncbi:growth factor receptor-bound protein 7 isoform X1 [Monodelphis domestica]|uniref:Growth factor receptor bound protein 7 n=2 Tax=Monodelphis domestica TaxID=13616 RepID=F6WKI9_MONDO|nr:growth factor receptor-bound protein 7 isoform X1 [Monodelphis domestica]XP_016285973.1 growth factor receptor-bound protein 7 isoform X1 [Monodelphis domestica]XP_016285974.1 growth factor receptor-bound protein 7 isoform X1 [Monodelphis domestica]
MEALGSPPGPVCVPDVMDLDLSLPHLSNSSDDPSPEPGTPPGTPPGSNAHLPGELKRSQPLSIQASRKLREEELRASSLPAIPNPFPELCSPPSQSPILGAPSSGRAFLPRATSGTHVVKVYSEDGACRSVEVAADATARHVCEMLVQRVHALSDESWGLVECFPHLALERGLEDHESVIEVQSAWPVGGDNRFVFRKNFAKYELFKSSPHSLFPEVMVSSCLDTNTRMSHEELIQNFLNAGSCPEIQGFLQLRGSGRKHWKRFYCFLRRSGLYYSTKGTSKDPRHLQYVADVNESNVYLVTKGRKLYGMPTDFGFCVKPNKLRSPKGLRIFCSEDEQSRSCWVAAFRLFKYGMQLYKNYQQMQSRRIRPSWFGPTPLRSVSDNTLVAMDFSGHGGRVIENPREALSAALEEAQAWRKKTNHRYSLPTPCPSSTFSSAIHRSQPWFHGRISREDTQRLIGEQGLVDGVFLVRESQRNPQGFVLSLCHLQKVKHYLILPSEDEGRLYFSMDEGQTRFTDLLQLVEFHQLNRGILPCPLRHCCTRVAL